jgi:hypothetical protein
MTSIALFGVELAIFGATLINAMHHDVWMDAVPRAVEWYEVCVNRRFLHWASLSLVRLPEQISIRRALNNLPMYAASLLLN